MTDTSQAASRLKALRQKAGLSLREMAREIGWGATRYQHYEDRYKKPYLPIEVLDAILPVLARHGVPHRDLEKLTPAMPGNMREKQKAESDDLVFVPVYDVAAAAGDGTMVDAEHQTGRLAFLPEWLKSVTTAAPASLGVIMVRGDSMFPTLVDGDHILIDFTQTVPRQDGIFVIRLNDVLQVKRVTLHPGTGRLTISSDNPAYSAYPDLAPESIHVAGKVIWLGRRV
ncbi:MAG: S24 family peptidase [Alphaproteobacteria bacterium]